MYVINYEEREETEVELPGSKKTTMRWLVGRATGAKTYAMRFFDIKPGGVIPLHAHPEEHEIFVLQGESKLLGGEEGAIVKKDDVVFIPSEMAHGYDNTEGKESFQFICVIPLLSDKE